MVQRKNAKATSLILTAVILLLLLVPTPIDEVGMRGDAALKGRLLYPFFHVNLLHAALNCWCMLSVVFIFDISISTLLISYVISITFPCQLFAPDTLPTIGLSGVCFALMGQIAFLVEQRLKYNIQILLYIAIAFLFPYVNAWLHLYCYVIGLLVGYLNKPIS